MIGNKTQKNTKGFTLFFALLVASLALAIGAAIFDITLRELILSETATQSQYALYAADRGSECALYWDNKYVNAATNNNNGSNSAFATSSLDTQSPVSGVVCNGQDIAAAGTPPSPIAPLPTGWTTWSTVTGSANATTTFMIMGVSTAAPCTVVNIYKGGNPSVTSIVSHGYNTCTPGPIQIERVLQVSY